MASLPSTEIPLRSGSPVQFDCAREFFRQASFDDPTLCRLLGMEDMSDLGRVGWERLGFAAPETTGAAGAGGETGNAPRSDLSVTKPDQAAVRSAASPNSEAAKGMRCPPVLDWCLRVFVRGLLVPEEESRQVCGNEAFSALLALGLLCRAAKRPGEIFCPVWVYPADGFIMASDRRDDPEGAPFTPPADVVFPAIYAGTLRFLRLLPAVAGGDALDLCGGSGIGALHLSRTARSITADITPRSAFFAEFNARLNGVSVPSLCGDLFAPVAGKKFDLISAHPPFVPDAGSKMVYRDGGETGEELTRRIIEGLPNHLLPGGTCVILCVARDTEERPFEQRAHDWLGAAAAEFDVLFGLEKILTLEAVVDSMRKRGEQMTDPAARQLLVRLRSLGTRQFVHGALFVRRSASPVSQAPRRLRMASIACAHDFERVLAWRQHCRQAGFGSWLAGARPRLAPGLELTVRHQVKDGALVPVEFVFSISAGLEAALRPDAWLVPIVARLEGQSSVGEVFQKAMAADELPQGFTLDDFSRLVRDLIERGFLEVELPCEKPR